VEIPKTYDEDLTKRAVIACRLSEEEDKPELTGFIQLLFGTESKLSREDYEEHITRDECTWVFSPATIRHRMTPFFDQAFLEEFEDNL